MQTRFWAIGDTHLSFAKPKDMTRFSERWLDHADRLAGEWRRLIAPNDVVLVAGDVSWAQTVNKVLPDLTWLQSLPGRKILMRGNHDHWWKDIERVRKIVEPMGFYALEGDCLEFDGVLVCGAMGHVAPQDPYYRADPRKDRYNRELKRLELALQHATEKREAGQPLLLVMHYPPFTSEGKPTAYVDLITQYKPTICVYGHLHRDAEWEVARKGEYEGVLYILAASDYLQMIPVQVWPQLAGQDSGGQLGLDR